MRPATRSLVALTAAAFALFLSSCATVSEPGQVVRPPQSEDISPTLQDPAKRVLKRKVVIARFNNETLRGKSVLLTDKTDLLEGQATDILATRLAHSGKFLLFERSDSERILVAVDDGNVDEVGLPADLRF